jgi:hypothetical protein
MIDVSEKVRYAIMLNPWAAILQQFRHAVIDPEAPTRRRGGGRLRDVGETSGGAVWCARAWLLVLPPRSPRMTEDL